MSLLDFPALKSFVRRKPVTLTPFQCDYCRNELGPSPHLYWRMRFCSLTCMSAYQRRLSSQTREKIAVLEPKDFFQNQVKQCRSQAESAASKSDRQFWLQLADRWERLSQAGGAGIKAEQKPSFDRPVFRKKKTFAFAKRRAA
jgi:hypothetical protein